MKTYELTYIISPEVNSEEIEAKEKEIESAIQTRDGVIIKQTKPAAKTLAYPVGKFSSGFFGIVEFQLDEGKLPEIADSLSKDAKIVRNMVIIKQQFKAKKIRRSREDQMPSILSEKKTETPEVKIEEPKIPAFEEKPEEKAVEEPKGKVELKDIEQELQDILGE